MTGAMYAGISGMRAHMNKLNVIGNNVANVNTVGYKAGFAVFHESLYSTTRAGSNGTATSGGLNPIQIGYGCKIGSVGLDMSTKNYMPTGRSMDCMIDGEGFFMVGDKNLPPPVAPESLMMTRMGTLEFKDGYLTDGNGNVVYGFLRASAEGGTGAIDPATGAGQFNPGGAVVAGQTEGYSTALVPIRLPQAAGAPADAAGPAKGTALYPSAILGSNTVTDRVGEGFVQLESISISGNGALTGINKVTGETVTIGVVPVGQVENPNGVTHMGGPYYKALGGAGKVNVAAMGGVIEGQMNNAVAAAGTIGITSKGSTVLQTSGLESSGADVATEFSEMITTQRGYQANTRIITVTDSMLEELVNIKR